MGISKRGLQQRTVSRETSGGTKGKTCTASGLHTVRSRQLGSRHQR